MPQGSEWEGKKLQFAGWSKTGHSLVSGDRTQSCFLARKLLPTQFPNSILMGIATFLLQSFVHQNNLYYQPGPEADPVEVTRSGNETTINGVANWLYEGSKHTVATRLSFKLVGDISAELLEEIFHDFVTHWWNPSSSVVCFAEIDDSQVTRHWYPWYGPATNLYPQFESIHYNKVRLKPVIKEPREFVNIYFHFQAGSSSSNPTITLKVADVTSSPQKHLVVAPPQQLLRT